MFFVRQHTLCGQSNLWQLFGPVLEEGVLLLFDLQPKVMDDRVLVVRSLSIL